MKIEIGSLYRTLIKDENSIVYREVIYKVLSCDYDHHKGYSEYLISPILSMKQYDTDYIYPFSSRWVRESELLSFEKLSKTHPAWLLYGRD